MTKLRMAAALCLLAPALLASATSSAQCSSRELKAKDAVTIPLHAIENGVREKPAFYLRIESPTPLVLFFRPEDVVAVMEERVRTRHPASFELIRRDMPLREDTDLFKYGLRDQEFGSQLDSLVASLLDKGDAAVDFMPLHAFEKSGPLNDEFDPTSIKRIHWKSRGGDGRKYCDLQGYQVLWVLDTIYD